MHERLAAVEEQITRFTGVLAAMRRVRLIWLGKGPQPRAGYGAKILHRISRTHARRSINSVGSGRTQSQSAMISEARFAASFHASSPIFRQSSVASRRRICGPGEMSPCVQRTRFWLRTRERGLSAVRMTKPPGGRPLDSLVTEMTEPRGSGSVEFIMAVFMVGYEPVTRWLDIGFDLIGQMGTYPDHGQTDNAIDIFRTCGRAALPGRS